MKRLIVLFLLISFFIPFTAEGVPFLQIQDERYSGNEREITFTVLVNNGYDPVEVEEFGFDVVYDPDILEYQDYTRGDLMSGFYLSVSNLYNDTLTVHGYRGRIDPGAIGELMTLTFILKEYKNTTLELSSLLYDMQGWNTVDGDLKAGGESGGSGPLPLLLPPLPILLPPLPSLNIPGFIPPPGLGFIPLPALGYLGCALPQWYPPVFPPVPHIDYNYYELLQILTYQDLTYYWQISSMWQLYSQPLWPY